MNVYTDMATWGGCGSNSRVPTSFRDQIRVEAALRGSSVSTYECRPPWHLDLTEWSKVRVAQLRYSADTHHWSPVLGRPQRAMASL